MHIVFVTDYALYVSGGVRFLLDVLNYVSCHFNYKVTVVAGYVDREVQIRYRNLNFLNMSTYYESKYLSEQPIRALAFILKALRNLIYIYDKINIIHLNNIIPTLISYLLPNKVPIVASIHHLEVPTGITHRLGRISISLVQDVLEINAPYVVIHTPSKYVKSLLQKKSFRNKDNIIIIPPCIDIKKYLLLKRKIENGLFLMIGRLEARKHYKHAIYAFKIINNFYPEARLIIVGDGPLRDELWILVKKLGLQNVVDIMGHVPEKEKLNLLSRAEALIHLGYPEGFGIVLIEALAAGVPVIAYDVPPLNEIIKHNVTGILVKKDSIIDLAKIVINFHKYSFNEKDLRNNARKYDIKFVASRFVKLYKSLVRQAKV